MAMASRRDHGTKEGESVVCGRRKQEINY